MIMIHNDDNDIGDIDDAAVFCSVYQSQLEGNNDNFYGDDDDGTTIDHYENCDVSRIKWDNNEKDGGGVIVLTYMKTTIMFNSIVCTLYSTFKLQQETRTKWGLLIYFIELILTLTPCILLCV